MGYGTSQRTKVHVVAVKREAYAKEKVKQIFLKMFVGGREEGQRVEVEEPVRIS